MSDDIWYDIDGSSCSLGRAYELLDNPVLRNIATASLDFQGYQVLVTTTFVPIDMNPLTHGAPTATPSLWVSEIIGGPPDIEGRTECYITRDDAIEGHQRMIEQALSSGCVLA